MSETIRRTAGSRSRRSAQRREDSLQAEPIQAATLGQLLHTSTLSQADEQLLARRLAAFDTSPLNCSKLRSLYRTLLTIDFACPTNERPDPSRAYTADEWTAYQKLANGGTHPEAHEVVDQFWWSANVSS